MDRYHSWWERHRWVVLGVSLIVVVGVSAVAVDPIRAVWDVPQVAQPALPADDVELELTKSTLAPTPTTIALPDDVELPILMYHYVSDLPAHADEYRRDLTVSPEAFETQLDYLSKADYHPVTLTDLYLHLTEGYPLPERPVILTFDDGYRDAYEVVFPKLVEHGFPATFFVLATPAHYESEAYLTWSEMKEMSDAGMDIEAHGRDHVDLRGRSHDFLVYQILGIKEAIEHHTGLTARFFCYPSGRWDEDVIEVLKSAGYRGAVTTEWGRTHTRHTLFELDRVRISGADTLGTFVAKLEG